MFELRVGKLKFNKTILTTRKLLKSNYYTFVPKILRTFSFRVVD